MKIIVYHPDEAMDSIKSWVLTPLEFLRDVEQHGKAAVRKSNKALVLGKVLFISKFEASSGIFADSLKA